MPRPLRRIEKQIAQVNKCFKSFRAHFDDVPSYVEGVSTIAVGPTDVTMRLRIKPAYQWKHDQYLYISVNRKRYDQWLINSALFEFVQHGE